MQIKLVQRSAVHFLFFAKGGRKNRENSLCSQLGFQRAGRQAPRLEQDSVFAIAVHRTWKNHWAEAHPTLSSRLDESPGRPPCHRACALCPLVSCASSPGVRVFILVAGDVDGQRTPNQMRFHPQGFVSCIDQTWARQSAAMVCKCFCAKARDVRDWESYNYRRPSQQ